MRLRIAKIDQEPITQILGDVTVIAGDDRSASLAVGLHDLMVVFQIELTRQRCRAHQVTEQNCELASLGLTRGRDWRSIGRVRGSRRLNGRHVRAKRRRLHLADGRDPPIAPTMHRLDIPRRSRRIAQHLTQSGNTTFEHRIAHIGGGPAGIQKRFFGAELAGATDENLQDGKVFFAQAQTRRAAPETRIRRIQAQRFRSRGCGHMTASLASFGARGTKT